MHNWDHVPTVDEEVVARNLQAQPRAAVHSLAEAASDADLAITNLMSAFGLAKAQAFEQLGTPLRRHRGDSVHCFHLEAVLEAAVSSCRR